MITLTSIPATATAGPVSALSPASPSATVHAASSSASELGGIAGWAAGLMETLGAVGAGIAIALENLFPPLPSEVILPLAGFTAASGDLDLVAVLLWTTIGSVVGALALYAIGAVLGRDRTLALAARIPLLKTSDFERTEQWFARHGTKAVFFGRMIPVFRSLISVPAGVERMRLPVFLGLTTLGSLIWNCLFVLAGYGLGSRWQQVSDIVSLYSKGVMGALALAVIVFVVFRLTHGNSRRSGSHQAGSHGSASREAGASGAGASGADKSGADGPDAGGTGVDGTGAGGSGAGAERRRD